MITADTKNERMNGEDQKIVPRHCDVPVTVYLDVQNLVIDKSAEVQTDLPGIRDMMARLAPMFPE